MGGEQFCVEIKVRESNKRNGKYILEFTFWFNNKAPK